MTWIIIYLVFSKILSVLAIQITVGFMKNDDLVISFVQNYTILCQLSIGK